MTELAAHQLRRRCDPATLGFASTAEVEPLEGVVGQPRALAAIEFGLGVKAHGYNIFATGPIGTGKRSTLESYLDHHAADRPTPGDWVYLHDFSEAERPLAVALPSGRGMALARQMARFVEETSRQIPRAFESESYQARRRRLTEALEARREQVFGEVREFAWERDIELELTPSGVVKVPVIDGKQVKPEDYEKRSEEVKESFRERGKEVDARMEEVMHGMREIERDALERLRALDREVALFAVGHLVDDIKADHEDVEAVQRWLDAVREDMIGNLGHFHPAGSAEAQGAPPAAAAEMQRARAQFIARYEVNVLVSNADGAGAPVIVEPNPTYYNLFGAVEYETSFGAALTDHRRIRPGAVHRANGGYLLLQAVDVFGRPELWDKLKEVLGTGQAKIENMGAQYTMFPTVTLEPQPIPLDLKVILVGPSQLHRTLYGVEEDFQKLFKVKADFDTEMPWEDVQPAQYAAFISGQVRERKLRHFDAGAVARVVEHGARVVEDQRRLSTSFIQIADLVTEADHWAGADGADLVGDEHVTRAVEERVFRSNLVEQKLRELVTEGTLLIDIEGQRAGQVNGLAVSSLGDYSFGHPVRITASTAAGKGEVVSIDRETELSGPIHDKGFMILTGYLGERYGRDRLLSLHTSITFEQSYEEVEGDSASCAELYALLSSLADAPIEQGIAVTGSVNQRGEVQPIGGANEKVEGFFEVCRQLGLNGRQGVIVPETNLRNLMLKDEVVAAVEQGQFKLWSAATVDQGIEILTGVKAGELGPDGAYPEASLHGRVERRLAELAAVVKESQPHRGDDA